MKPILMQLVTAIVLFGLMIEPLFGQKAPKNVPQNVSVSEPKKASVHRGTRKTKIDLQKESLLKAKHLYEIRVGPRFSWIDGKIRPGRDGSSQLDFRDDFGLTEVEIGPQVDFEIKFSDQWHGSINYAQNYFDGPKLTTTKTILYQNSSTTGGSPSTQQTPTVFPTGSSVQGKLEINSINALLYYDVFKKNGWALSPVVGTKAVFFKEKLNLVSITSGLIVNDSTFVERVIPLVGCSARYQFNRQIYCGAMGAGFAFEKYIYAEGQSYLGYDFDKTWGLRMGMDVNYISAGRGSSGPTFSTTGYVAGGFLEGVVGF